MDIASLVVGLIAAFFFWFPVFGIPLGVIGLILGIAGYQVKKAKQDTLGLAIAGVVLSLLGLLPGVYISYKLVHFVTGAMQTDAGREAYQRFQEQRKAHEARKKAPDLLPQTKAPGERKL